MTERLSDTHDHRRLAGRALALLAAGALLLAACGGSDDSDNSTDTGEESAAEVEEFGYEGDIGPEFWGELDPEWEVCATGNEQSPIDLGPAESAELDAVTITYVPVTASVADVGATIKATFSPGSSILVDGITFNLLQVHFHAPSEHVVDGAAADAEFHFVHEAADGALAVIGILVDDGEANDVYAPLIDAIGATPKPGQGDPVEVDIDVAALMGDVGATYRYDGSLTTPPCSEGVRWIVRGERITLSSAQIDILTERYEGNARPAQDLGERDLLSDLPTGG